MSRWIHCRKCNYEYSSQLSRCPQCSCVTINFKLVSSLVAFVVVLTVAVIGFVMGLNDNTPNNKIEAVSENSSVTDKASDKKSPSNSKNKDKGKSEDKKQKSTIDNVLKDLEEKVEVTSSEEKKESKEETVNTDTHSTPVYKYKIGTEMLGDIYYITLPEYYLRYVYELSNLQDSGISFESYAYELDDEAKEAGFISVCKNSDGSATRAITSGKYRVYLTDFTVGIVEYKAELKRQDYIDNIVDSDNLSSIKITLKKRADEITVAEYLQIILLGCLGGERQLSSVNSSNSCNVQLVYSDGSTENLAFPECLHK